MINNPENVKKSLISCNVSKCGECELGDEVYIDCENTLRTMAEQTIDTLEKELAEANRVKRDAINELCHKCGRYREEHNGACDGCRWHHGKA